MNILNSSHFSWAYSFCQNMKLTGQLKHSKALKMNLTIHSIKNSFIASVVVCDSGFCNNASEFKIMIDVVPEDISWIDMYHRWQQMFPVQELGEYYVYAPHSNDFFAWQRTQGQLRFLPKQQIYLSRFLNLRFEHYANTLEIFTAKRHPFLSFEEQMQAFEETKQRLTHCENELLEKHLLLEKAYKKISMLEQRFRSRTAYTHK